MKPLNFTGDDCLGADEKWWPEIAFRCRCPRVGDEVRLGDIVSLRIEPGVPYGRIVAFIHKDKDGNPTKGMYRTLVRVYQKGDTWFPTGGLRYGALEIAYCPWMGATDALADHRDTWDEVQDLLDKTNLLIRRNP